MSKTLELHFTLVNGTLVPSNGPVLSPAPEARMESPSSAVLPDSSGLIAAGYRLVVSLN
jgi:hypothetical protein